MLRIPLPEDDGFALAKHVRQSMYLRNHETEKKSGYAAGLPEDFPQAPLSYKDRSSRTPWHYVPRDDDFALAKHVR